MRHVCVAAMGGKVENEEDIDEGQEDRCRTTRRLSQGLGAHVVLCEHGSNAKSSQNPFHRIMSRRSAIEWQLHS